MLYNEDLNEKWFTHLKNNTKNLMSLSNFYEIYNSFYSLYDKEIFKYINVKYKESLDNIEDVYNRKFTKKVKSNKKTANSNILRSSKTQLFCTCKHDITGEWIEAFTDDTYNNISETFKESRMTYKNIENDLINLLKDKNRTIFTDYIYVKQKFKIDTLRDMAKQSDKPYFRYDIKYSNDFGIYQV